MTPFAVAVRVAEAGFRAQLLAVLADADHADPARDRCHALLAALGDAPAAASVVAPAPAADRLGERFAAAWGEAGWARLFGPPPAGDGATVWAVLHWRARRAADDAGPMLAALAELARAGGFAPASPAVVVPGPDDAEIVPGLADGPAGWAASASAPLPPELPLPDDADAELTRVARAAGLVLAAAGDAPEVCFAHPEIDRRPWVRADAVSRGAFRAVLAARWADLVAPGPAEPSAVWRRHVRLDEALHAILCDPLPAAGSWWERTLAAARFALLRRGERLAAAAGVRPEWSLPRGKYTEAAVRTAPIDDVPWPAGPAGEALWCLRVSSRVGGEWWPGRVVYAPR